MIAFVVGLTSEEAIRFEAVKQTVLEITARKSMAAAIQESRIRQAGV